MLILSQWSPLVRKLKSVVGFSNSTRVFSGCSYDDLNGKFLRNTKNKCALFPRVIFEQYPEIE